MYTHPSFLFVCASISWLCALAGDIVLLAVVSTVVRRHRPDAYEPLLAWAVAGLSVPSFAVRSRPS